MFGLDELINNCGFADLHYQASSRGNTHCYCSRKMGNYWGVEGHNGRSSGTQASSL